MLHWKKLFGRARPNARPSARPTLHLLLISRDAVQAAALERITAELGWTFTLAPSAATAAELAPAGPTVIVFDRNLPDGDWRRALPRLAALPHTACLLLASAVADEYLWQEVSRHGGDDLLGKPWQSAELSRLVAFAAVQRAWAARPRIGRSGPSSK